MVYKGHLDTCEFFYANKYNNIEIIRTELSESYCAFFYAEIINVQRKEKKYEKNCKKHDYCRSVVRFDD